jgi:hypothetical protein
MHSVVRLHHREALLRPPARCVAESATLLFIALKVLVVTLAGNAFEVTEKNRFRFTFDPLIWVVIAVVLSRRGSELLRRAPASPPR